MAQTAQAYGLIPVFSDSGQTRAKKYNILNNAGTGYVRRLRLHWC
jgi:hypothetical protein